ncbi:MAG TPA: glycerol-3-phosphate 1-O-acyltransferase PlsY [Acidobacteriaceae bacterium]|jgi:glycerol-3-phosphate acyltransferase PlsY|nr:glycerol-3-phosphate 1-O-acyltransferase PlsY [Acidobacteriaceae bacterium]
MHLWLPTLALAYLLGSIPFGYLLVRLFRKQDIRSVGSGNIGATNVARSGSKGLGILTLVLDLLKAFAAVLLAKHLAPGMPGFPSDLAVAAGIAAVLGHVFPVWLGFKGGKGVASALGVFLALAWPAAVSALILFLLIFAITRYVSLASILAAVMLPPFALLWMPDRTPIFVGGVIFLALLVISKHHSNITRLLQGREDRFGRKKSPPDNTPPDNTPDKNTPDKQVNA